MDLKLGDTQLIIAECQKYGCTRKQAAYILATAYWETARTMKPVMEAFWLSDAWRAKNLRYYPWHGRGYVQITWQANYIKAGQRLDMDLTSNPDVVMRPDVSATILVRGSMEGWFTKHKLPDHVSAAKTDYINARRVINGTDKAKEIAELAEQYHVTLLNYDMHEPVNETPKSEHVPNVALTKSPLSNMFASFIAALAAFIMKWIKK